MTIIIIIIIIIIITTKYFKNTIWKEEIDSKWRLCKLENAFFCGKLSI